MYVDQFEQEHITYFYIDPYGDLSRKLFSFRTLLSLKYQPPSKENLDAIRKVLNKNLHEDMEDIIRFIVNTEREISQLANKIEYKMLCDGTM